MGTVSALILRLVFGAEVAATPRLRSLRTPRYELEGADFEAPACALSSEGAQLDFDSESDPEGEIDLSLELLLERDGFRDVRVSMTMSEQADALR